MMTFAFQTRRFLTIFILCVLNLSSCQRISIDTSDVANQASQALSLTVNTEDIPGRWSGVFVKVQQPSQAKWINPENMSDSAGSDLKGDYLFAGKRHYISVFHNIAQYSKPIPEAETIALGSVFGDRESTDLLSVANFGNKTEAACFVTEYFYDCTVVVSYQFTRSFLTIIVPKELGVQELENLLNSVSKAINDKIIQVEQN